MKNAWLRAAGVALVSLAVLAGCNAVTGADSLQIATRRDSGSNDATEPSARDSANGAKKAAGPAATGSSDGGTAGSGGGSDASSGPIAPCASSSECANDELCCLLAPDVAACVPGLACAGMVVLCEDDTDCEGSQSCIAVPGGYGACR